MSQTDILCASFKRNFTHLNKRTTLCSNSNDSQNDIVCVLQHGLLDRYICNTDKSANLVQDRVA